MPSQFSSGLVKLCNSLKSEPYFTVALIIKLVRFQTVTVSFKTRAIAHTGLTESYVHFRQT